MKQIYTLFFSILFLTAFAPAAQQNGAIQTSGSLALGF
jgi:hypothetical protein